MLAAGQLWGIIRGRSPLIKLKKQPQGVFQLVLIQLNKIMESKIVIHRHHYLVLLRFSASIAFLGIFLCAFVARPIFVSLFGRPAIKRLRIFGINLAF